MNRIFEVQRDQLSATHIREVEPASLTDGHIRLRVDAFAFTANNITYGVAGDRLGYWQFFPVPTDHREEWGVLPVWGFADVVESRADEIEVGARVFGYFPPAITVDMLPANVRHSQSGKGGFTDASEHRNALPAGYNAYRFARPASPQAEAERMLLFPLHLTSWCLWDNLVVADWHGASQDSGQVVTLSASSKTALGLAHALHTDATAPTSIAMTSPHRVKTVAGLRTYDEVLGYDEVARLPVRPTVVVDMSGNTTVLDAIADHLGDDLRFISRVGITHWDETEGGNARVAEASKMFFAPSHVAGRMTEWGPAEFNARTSAFLEDAARASRSWLEVNEVQGLDGLQAIYADVLQGLRPASEGIIVRM